MWSLYNNLIDGINEEILTEEVVAGLSWTGTQSKTLGLAMSPPRQLKNTPLSGTCINTPIKELAENVKSWNFMEAAIGLSTINSFYNTIETVEQMTAEGTHLLSNESAFKILYPQLAGKKVGVIGHFPNSEEMAKHCDLSIFERKSTFGDLPDPAVEYILPEQDFVFITASTLVNKTAPRLLELSENAVTVLLGPSTTFSPHLFNMGVDILSGLIVENNNAVLNCIKEGGGVSRFRQHVNYVNLSRKSLKELGGH